MTRTIYRVKVPLAKIGAQPGDYISHNPDLTVPIVLSRELGGPLDAGALAALAAAGALEILRQKADETDEAAKPGRRRRKPKLALVR